MNRAYQIVCIRCNAQTVIDTDGNGHLVEIPGVCRCPARPETPNRFSRYDVPLSAICCDCHGPCRANADRCTKCGNLFRSAETKRLAAERIAARAVRDAEICRLLDAGMLGVDVAVRFRLTPGAISIISRRRLTPNPT